jgi:hypothetical protein
MNLRFILVAVLVASASTISCSSDDAPPVSGGAKFQLQAADSTAAMGLDTCPDSGKEFLIAIQGDDGQPKLMVDGADDARVKCQIDGSHFDLSVSNKNGTIAAAGSYSGNVSKDAQVTVVYGSNQSYSSKGGVACTLTFENPGGSVVQDGGKIRAGIVCPALKHKTLNAACGIDVSGGSGAFMQFSNCTGF